ncbi:N-acetyl-alpha-D-glucosaminyl L-malate synthase BshA [Calditerricola satsumensis]|uniref:Glycosyl transferase n=1 Tax=Calditerricola satsumensis TaxID=373054 RepID=A0A8J3B563_9BACI|nr:N-acetyl-alpha-D-glucosaminyl L-malate synthase BshA [Calditerricola satsumensis]GGJ96291.1 glycosyl transferase [Calditerricola satsumensis]
MRIGITCYPTLGGSGVVATELGKLLAERGHEVHFITSSVPFRLGRFMKNVYVHEVEVVQYDVFRHPPYDLALAARMAQVARLVGLDLLHVHYAVPHAISAYLAKQMVGPALKVVTTLHGTDITVLGYDQTMKCVIRFGIEQSDAVTAVSDSLVEETRRLLHVDKPIRRIYNFVDTRVYDRRDASDLRREWAPRGEAVLIHISNFRPVKRPVDVVEVFARVRRTLPAKLVLIGEGPQLPLVQERLAAENLHRDVLFLGRQADVAPLLSAADLLLLPSEKESFGLVALEAMACGVPVIATRTGGLPEVVVDGECGFLSPVGDVAKMAADALTLLADRDLYARFSANARRRAHERFAAERICDEYEALYREVVEAPAQQERV